MIDTTTPNDDTTSDKTPDIWALIEQVQNELAHNLRLHEAGKDVSPEKVIRAARMVLEHKKGPSVTEEAETVFLARDLLLNYWAKVTEHKNTATTGFAGLNEILSGGIESQRLLILLGAPNTGKTTFAHQMADFIASSGRPVLYVTSEDTPNALIAKTLARTGKVDYTPVLKGWPNYEASIKQAIASQLASMSSERLCYLDATGNVDLLSIREAAATHFSKFSVGQGVIFVDYLQRIARAIKRKNNLSQDLRNVVTDVADELRDMAKTMDCAVIAIASQNRGGYTRSEGSTGMASAKESGDIEYTCDVLMALAEDKDRKKTVPHLTPITLYIDKNRQGPRDRKINLDFYADRQQFTEAIAL
jgi:replicative DNA helicase